MGLRQDPNQFFKGLMGQDDFQFPFYWELLDDNSGNSNSNNHTDLLKKIFNMIDKKN
jgi:hypothetical protein